MRTPHRPRVGFTLTEILVALGILGAVSLVMTEIAGSIHSARRRNAAREAAIEAAANVLEAARVCPWEELSPAWGNRQTLSPSLAERLPEGRLEVHVEPEAGRPRTRRVSIEIRWLRDDRSQQRVRLVGLASARSMPVGERKP